MGERLGFTMFIENFSLDKKNSDNFLLTSMARKIRIHDTFIARKIRICETLIACESIISNTNKVLTRKISFDIKISPFFVCIM